VTDSPAVRAVANVTADALVEFVVVIAGRFVTVLPVAAKSVTTGAVALLEGVVLMNVTPVEVAAPVFQPVSVPAVNVPIAAVTPAAAAAIVASAADVFAFKLANALATSAVVAPEEPAVKVNPPRITV
jgi:hypothetical protein